MNIREKLEWILLTDKFIHQPRYTESISSKGHSNYNIIDIAKYIKRKC